MLVPEPQPFFDATVLLQQLGGSRFKAMTGAKNFLKDSSRLSFQLGGGAKHQINRVRITLEANDTYTMEFFRYRTRTLRLVEKVEDVHAASLQAVFTRVTGFDTHL